MKQLSFFIFYFSLFISLVACTPKQTTLTILHTNDTHSQIEPVEDNGSRKGLGGYARRMGYIAQERQADPDLLLLDAGDFSQGTPYFNFYKGRVEMDALNRMGYDAGTLGNHEFDNGLDTLAMVLRLAHHPIVCCNYDFTGTPLEGLVQPYTIINRKGVKVGVIGVGTNPKDLVARGNFEPAVWHEPYEIVDELATILKEEKHCDLVICLSHLGTFADVTDPTRDCDTLLISRTHNIDLVIGGHTHQLHADNETYPNRDGKPILYTQSDKSGAHVGKVVIDLATE